MKTILAVLGGLFLLHRLNGGGVAFNLSATASPIPGGNGAGSPFGTTPAGGGAGIIILPQNDPYGDTYNQGAGGGGAGVPLDPSTLGSAAVGAGFSSGFRPVATFPRPVSVAGSGGPVRSTGFHIA